MGACDWLAKAILGGGSVVVGPGAGPEVDVSDQSLQEGQLILYGTADDAVRVEVLYESETFWLDLRRMAELFGVDVRTVSYHLKEVYASGELSREATLRRIWRVQREGNREVRREIEFYNHAEEQYDKFRVRRDHEFESDFEPEVKRIKSMSPKNRKEEP
jgi:hypothetical protein